MTILVAGDKVPDAAALETLPVGAAVTEKSTQKLLTRHPEAHGKRGGWASHYNNSHRPSDQVWWDGMELVSLPGIIYDGPMVGDVITTAEQLDALPEAAVVVRHQGTENYSAFKIGPNTPGWPGDEYVGQWYDYYHGRCSSATLIQNLRDYTVVVESLPVDLFETLDQFKWRFRDLAITGNERALGSSKSARTILEALKVEFTPSVGMRITNQHDRAELPDGSRVYVGSPEGDPGQFAVWQKREGKGWDRVFGEATTTPVEAVAVVVDALPADGTVKTEPDEWFAKVATPEDAAQVRAMRRSGWIEGLKEKAAHSWCDEFERVMLRGGMSEELTKLQLPGGIKVGDSVTVEQAASLPVGSLFTVTEDGQVVGIYRRTADAKNKAGTERLWGSNGFEKKGNYQPGMTLINDAVNNPNDTGDLWVPMPDQAFMAALPIGSRIARLEDARAVSGRFYQKIIDTPGMGGGWKLWRKGRGEPVNAIRDHLDGAFWTRSTSSYGVTRFGEGVEA